jgi:serpin B
MYLINAIYFKGMWQDSFDKENTKNGFFYLKDGSAINTPMMSQYMKLKTTSNELFTMVDLPYGQGNFSMVVMIPQPGHTTGEITKELTTGNWDGWMSNLVERDVTLVFPKFTFEYKNNLNEVLSSMGMEVAFSDAADFSGINGTGYLKISRVLHKTFVEVNEEGTEAAAVTAVEIIATSAVPDIIAIDHPFLFAIREVKTGTILFIGRVQDPTVKSN